MISSLFILPYYPEKVKKLTAEVVPYVYTTSYYEDGVNKTNKMNKVGRRVEGGCSLVKVCTGNTPPLVWQF